MRRYPWILALFLVLGISAARAESGFSFNLSPIGIAQAAIPVCVPSAAQPGSMGCEPVATSMLSSDYIQVWQPGNYPWSAQLITLQNLLQGQGGFGSVTSVGVVLPTSTFVVTNSPVTTNGTITATLASQTPNTFFAGPTTGSAGVPTWRTIVPADLPVGTNSAKGALECDAVTTSCSSGIISVIGGGGGGGSTTFTDGTNSVANTTIATFGNGFVIGGSSGSATVNLNSPIRTVTSCASSACNVAAGDMGGQVNFNGSSLTVVFPAISSTIFAKGSQFALLNYNSTALTISSTPTINGFSGTSIPQGGGIICSSDGTALYCFGTGTLASIPALASNQTWTGTQTFGPVIQSINLQTGTTYTLQASDCGKRVVATNAGAITITTFQAAVVGCSTDIEQGGAGQVTIANGGSATLVSSHAYTKTFNAKGAVINLFTDANAGSAAEWVLAGDGA